MASGTGAQIGLAKINSLYSNVTTINIFQSFVSETLEHTLEELEEGAISGRRDAPISYKGIEKADGDLELELNPNNFAHFLKGWFGTHVASTVTAAGSTGANSGDTAGQPYNWHRFTPRQLAYSGFTFLEPYNVMVYRDVGSAWILKGAIFPKLMIDISAGAIVKGTVGVMARSIERMDRVPIVQSLVSSGGRPWIWDMASVEISTVGIGSANLIARTNFESIKLTFDMKHEGVVVLDGTKFQAEFQPSDFRRINIEGNMTFRDQTDYEAFIAYESKGARITLQNVNSNIVLGNPASVSAANFQGYFGMRINIPRMKFLSWSAPVKGPNRLTAAFTAKAEYDEVSGKMVDIELNATVSSTVLTTVY